MTLVQCDTKETRRMHACLPTKARGYFPVVYILANQKK